MSSSIDYGTLALGTLIGVGCRKQLKSAAKVTATMAASLAASTAQAMEQVAEETKSPEEKAANAWLQNVDQQVAGANGQKNG